MSLVQFKYKVVEGMGGYLAIVHSKVSESSTVFVRRRFEGMVGYPGYSAHQG